jgi:hypothetical protein
MAMKVFAVSVIVAIGLGAIAAAALNRAQTLAYQAYSTGSTRVSQPGHNLVGEAWTGDAAPRS